MGRRGKGKGNRGAKNSTHIGSQAAKISVKNVDEIEQNDNATQFSNVSAKDVVDHQKRNGLDTVEITSDTPAAIVDIDGIIEVDKNGERITSDTPATTDSKRDETLVAKRRTAPAKAFLTCASPMQYPEDKFCLPVESLQATKLKDIDERTQTLDSKTSNTQKVLLTNNESTVTEAKTEENVSLPSLQYYKAKDEQEQNLDIKASKLQHQLSSENNKSAFAEKAELNQPKFWEQCFEELNRRLQKTQEDIPSDCSASLQFLQYMAELTRQLKTRKVSKSDLALLSEIEMAVTEEKSHEEFTKMLKPYFETFIKEQYNPDFKVAKLQPDLSPENEKIVTEPKTEVSESEPLLEEPIIMGINESIQNLDLNALEVQHDQFSENQSKLNEPRTKESEKVINLKRDVNLSMEFNEHGKKIILVDRERYVVDEKQKITFNIGEGNTQLSSIGNKVSVSTQEGQIDFSMQSNRVVFSLTDNNIKSDSLSEGTRTTQGQRSLDDSLEIFLTNIRTTCEDFENSFLTSLK